MGGSRWSWIKVPRNPRWSVELRATAGFKYIRIRGTIYRRHLHGDEFSFLPNETAARTDRSGEKSGKRDVIYRDTFHSRFMSFLMERARERQKFVAGAIKTDSPRMLFHRSTFAIESRSPVDVFHGGLDEIRRGRDRESAIWKYTVLNASFVRNGQQIGDYTRRPRAV